MTRDTFTQTPATRAEIPPITIRISGKAMSIMEGSELTADPVKYDGGTPAAREAHAALASAYGRRAGKGWTYQVEVSPDAARLIEDFCDNVGQSYLGGSDDPDDHADGRALMVVRDRIREALV